MESSRKIWLLVGLIIAIVGAGCLGILVLSGIVFFWSQSPAARPMPQSVDRSLLEAPLAAGPELKPAPAAAAKSPSPDFTMTAQEFLDEYKRDQKAAQKKYDKAIIQVTGVVHHIARTFRKEPWVILTQREGKETDSDGVRCVLSDKHAWTRVQTGRKITLMGECDSYGALLS